MRKLLLGIIVGLMFVSCAFATESQPTVTLVAKKSKAKRKTTPQRKPVTNQLSINDCVYRFNVAASRAKLDHNLSLENMIFSPGSVNDVYITKYADCLALTLVSVHDKTDFVQGYVLYAGDKTGNHAAEAIILIGELLYATGVTNELSDTANVLNRLGFGNLHDGYEKSIIENGWKVYITSNSMFGVMCGVEKP